MHARIKFLSHAKPLQRHQNKPLVTINFQPKSKSIPFKKIGTPIYESAQHLFKTTKEKTKKKSRTTSNDKEKCGADWQHRHHICLSHLSHCLLSSHPAGPTRPDQKGWVFFTFFRAIFIRYVGNIWRLKRDNISQFFQEYGYWRWWRGGSKLDLNRCWGGFGGRGGDIFPSGQNASWASPQFSGGWFWIALPANRLIFFRSISSLVHHSLGPWGWAKPGKN